MRVSSVNLQNTFSNISKKVASNPITSHKNIVGLGVGAATVSGMYLAKRNKEEYAKLKALGLKHNQIKLALNATSKDNGKPIFDNKGIRILADTTHINDSTFFNTIVENLEYIDKLKKFGDESNKNVSYQMHAKTLDTDITASMDVSKDRISVYIVSRQGLDRTIKEKSILKSLIVETLEKKERTKTVSLEKVIYDKDRNLIIKRQLDPTDRLTVKSYTQFTTSSNGDVTDTVSVVYDTNDKNNIRGRATSNDYKNNTIIKAVIGQDSTNMYAQEKYYRNSTTGNFETLKMEQSEIPGIYNSVIIDDKGNVKVESKIDKDVDGNTIVEKHFESFDGTKTDYTYKVSKNDNNIKMNYKITSKDGKVLANISRSFDRVNQNLAYSSVNGRNYVIEKNNEGYIVTDKFSNNQTHIKLSDLCLNDESLKHSEIFDKMSGDMILDFYNKGYKFNYVTENRKSSIQSVTKELNAKDDLFIFNHELGHAKDFKLSSDKDYNASQKSSVKQKRITPAIKKIYEEELKSFFEHSSDIERGYVSYLTDKMIFIDKEGHISEAVAETNALLSTAPGATYDGNLARDYYFQKYFPKTIAELSKLLLPNS